ncbi:hypothetical protein BC830DRAFT_1165260 [Chytriomyces sp. MP71]|nr:hypothetical protein BC830DRAFT_1165260 [Chytriomyces sp. MP71]
MQHSFAPVAQTPDAGTTPFSRFAVALPALFGVYLAAYSVLVPEWASFFMALSLAWVITIVADPLSSSGGIRNYPSMLDKWWLSSMLAILALSLTQTPFAPNLSASVAIAQAPMISTDALLITVDSLSGLPWGCDRRSVSAFAVFRHPRLAKNDGKFGHWSAVEVASIPHEEYIRIPLFDPTAEGTTITNLNRKYTAPLYGRTGKDETVFLISHVGDRDLMLKLGVSCQNFPADMIFGPELFLLDSGSSEFHRFTSKTRIPFPKMSIFPARLLSLLNPFSWPRRILDILRTYTTLIELGIVWPLLARILEGILLRYRADRVRAGKSIVTLDSENESVSVTNVLDGMGELFVALLAVVTGKTRSADVVGSSTSMATDKRKSHLSVKLTKTTEPIQQIENSGVSSGGMKERVRASSSPARSPLGYGRSPLSKPKTNSFLWDERGSRLVGSLLNTVGGMTQRKRKRWEKPGYVFVVIKSYEPIFKDELPISVGNIVRIKKIFDDGWALGVNESTNVQGILPMAFLTYINPGNPSNPPIDPQTFIPNPPTQTQTQASAASQSPALPSMRKQKTPSASPATTPLLSHDAMHATPTTLTEFFSDEPPPHLKARGRGRSISRSRSYTNPVVSSMAVTPPTPSATGTVPLPTSFPSLDRPRGRSSSMHRRARSKSLKKKPSQVEHVKDAFVPAAKGGLPGRRRSSGASEMQRKMRESVATLPAPLSPDEVTVFPGDDSGDDFASAVGNDEVSTTLYDPLTMGQEEVVVIDGESDESSGESSTEEDQDVWPRARPAAKRVARLSIASGYSHKADS